MWLKNRILNPVSGALCQTRQENAEMYRHFAEELYSRTEATTILVDQDSIKLLDQRPVNHLLAAELDEQQLYERLRYSTAAATATGGLEHPTVPLS